eukprot:1195327-Prorocentrum_minimum.AAC.2
MSRLKLGGALTYGSSCANNSKGALNTPVPFIHSPAHAVGEVLDGLHAAVLAGEHAGGVGPDAVLDLLLQVVLRVLQLQRLLVKLLDGQGTRVGQLELRQPLLQRRLADVHHRHLAAWSVDQLRERGIYHRQAGVQGAGTNRARERGMYWSSSG